MNKIRVIDLLNKIANGEEVPKKIKHRDKIYEYYERLNDTFNYKEIIDGKYADDYLNDKYFIENILNDQVEIIEEDKKLEKLNNIPINYADDRKPEEVYEYLRCTINNLANVINVSNENLFELIDKVNSLENK